MSVLSKQFRGRVSKNVRGSMYSRLKAVLHSNLREYSTTKLLSIRDNARTQFTVIIDKYGHNNDMAARQNAIVRVCTVLLNERGVK